MLCVWCRGVDPGGRRGLGDVLCEGNLLFVTPNFERGERDRLKKEKEVWQA